MIRDRVDFEQAVPALGDGVGGGVFGCGGRAEQHLDGFEARP